MFIYGIIDSVHLKPFNLNHLPLLAQWLNARGLDASVIDELPAIGLVAYEGDKPIAAGFLRLMEGDSTGMVDSLVTDPGANPQLRDKANSFITDGLVQEARRLNLKQVIALSIDPNTIERAKRHGFVSTPHVTLVLKL